MPHKPQPAPHPDTKTYITIPIPGWLKNELIQSAHTHNQSLQKHTTQLLTNALRNTQNKPPLQNTPPNPIQPIINYLTGTRTLQPCGQPTCNQQPIKLNNTTYCNTCGIQTH